MSHTVSANELVSVDFNIQDTSGAAVDADSLPTAVLVKNGIDDPTTVTVTNKSVGVYNASVTLPSDLENGDAIQIRMSATIAGTISKAIIYQIVIGHAFPELELKLDFATQNTEGVAKNADSLPTAIFARNAVDDPTVINVVNKETGVYTLTGKIPLNFKEGDEIQVRVEAIVEGVLGKENIFLETLVSKPSVTVTTLLAYSDLIFADNYFKRKLHTFAWDEATDVQREAALQEAAIRIDRLNFRGAKADPSQTLQWPRKNTQFSETTIPEDIKIANAEVAFALLDGVDPDLELENLSATSEGASSMRTTYGRTTVPEHITAGIPSNLAWLHLRPLLADVKRIKLRRV